MEKHLTIQRWMKRNNLKAFLFDLDDTLIDTQSVFDQQVNRVLDILIKQIPQVSSDQLRNEFGESVALAHHLCFVNPRKLWRQTIHLLKQKHEEITRLVEEMCFSPLMGIYSILPPFHSGAIETLEIFSSARVPLGLVTHAQKRWTNFKMKKLGLDKYFELTEIADPNQPKTPEIWSSAIKKLNINSKEAVVVGDNVRGDIQAARRVGVNQLFWVDRKAMWEVYREGKLPSGTKVIQELLEIFDKIIP
jgi:FMN phosphatase YigB (HAD superfamily)